MRIIFAQVGCGWIQFPSARSDEGGFENFLVCNYGIGVANETTCDTAASANGKPVKKDITWKILKSAKNKQGVHETLYTSNETSPTVVLREGKYVVVAEAGDMAGESTLEVQEGKTAKLKVELKEGAKVASGS